MALFIQLLKIVGRLPCFVLALMAFGSFHYPGRKGATTNHTSILKTITVIPSLDCHKLPCYQGIEAPSLFTSMLRYQPTVAFAG